MDVTPFAIAVTETLSRNGHSCPRGPTADLTCRVEEGKHLLNATLNSVVFRSADQDLTTAGTYIEMTSRLLEPTLLALAALAIRGRIKR